MELSTPGAGDYDGNFTPPSCSLGLDAPYAQEPPAPPEAPAAAPSAQVPPAAPATGPDAVLGLAAPVDADSKGKAVMKVTKAQPVAWAPPPNNSGK